MAEICLSHDPLIHQLCESCVNFLDIYKAEARIPTAEEAVEVFGIVSGIYCVFNNK
jgi:hypothetical protein